MRPSDVSGAAIGRIQAERRGQPERDALGDENADAIDGSHSAAGYKENARVVLSIPRKGFIVCRRVLR